MRILFDLTALQPTLNAKKHGAGEYAKTVFFALLKRMKEIKLEGVFYSNRLLDEYIIENCKEKNIKLHGITNIGELKQLIETENYDKFYSSLPYKYYDICSDKTEFIYTLHGLRTYEINKDKYEKIFADTLSKKYKLIKKNLFENNQNVYDNFYRLLSNHSKTHFIVTSRHTLYSYLNTYPFFLEKKHTLLYSPAKLNEIDIDNNHVDSILSKFCVQKKCFFLIINANRWIKNSYRAVMALDQVYDSFPNIMINTVVLGITNQNFLDKMKHKERFRLYDYVETEELECLYKYAYTFIYPSLNEGFGYPPLEAMKYGTPVIASGTSSIPEICGEAALYFNPYLVNEIAIRVMQVLFDPCTIIELKKRGKERSKYISNKQDIMLNQLVDIIVEDKHNIEG